MHTIVTMIVRLLHVRRHLHEYWQSWLLCGLICLDRYTMVLPTCLHLCLLWNPCMVHVSSAELCGNLSRANRLPILVMPRVSLCSIDSPFTYESSSSCWKARSSRVIRTRDSENMSPEYNGSVRSPSTRMRLIVFWVVGRCIGTPTCATMNKPNAARLTSPINNCAGYRPPKRAYPTCISVWDAVFLRRVASVPECFGANVIESTSIAAPVFVYS